MSYGQVQSAVGESANIVSDPPTVMDMDLAPFCNFDDLRTWVEQGLEQLA